MTRRADVEDESGPSTLERQDRALDGPPTLVQHEASGVAPEPPTIVRIADADELGAPEPATQVKPVAAGGDGEVEAAPTVVRTVVMARPAAGLAPPDAPGGPDPETTASRPTPDALPLALWGTAPRWAKGLFLFGVSCFAAALVLWVVRSSRGDEQADPTTAESAGGWGREGAETDRSPEEPSPRDAPALPPGGATSSASHQGGAALGYIEADVGADPLADAAIDARAALLALREGVRTCVESTIGVMPGTSPPLPRDLSDAAGGYRGSPNDYASPFFMCTRLRVNGPMRFQMQWQLDKPSSEGTGVAWIDDDADGKPDRAFGFQGKLLERSRVELGEIGPIPATRPVRPR